MPVDPKELREAIRAAIYACRKMAKQHVAASAYRKPQANICEADRFYDAAEVLRAWLDSGLTDGERETVRDQMPALRRIRSEAHAEGYRWVCDDIDDVIAALAPIAEGK